MIWPCCGTVLAIRIDGNLSRLSEVRRELARRGCPKRGHLWDVPEKLGLSIIADFQKEES